MLFNLFFLNAKERSDLMYWIVKYVFATPRQIQSSVSPSLGIAITTTLLYALKTSFTCDLVLLHVEDD